MMYCFVLFNCFFRNAIDLNQIVQFKCFAYPLFNNNIVYLNTLFIINYIFIIIIKVLQARVYTLNQMQKLSKFHSHHFILIILFFKFKQRLAHNFRTDKNDFSIFFSVDIKIFIRRDGFQVKLSNSLTKELYYLRSETL